MLVQCLGSGDAFGSGGRLNTSFYIRSGATRILLDCGATTLVALSKTALSSIDVDVILISHLHGDHVGGISFIITERQVKGDPSQPLVVIGPKGLKDIIENTTTIFFPGIYENLRFPLRIVEFESNETISEDTFTIHTYRALHAPPTNPHSLRLVFGDRIIAYSGDTEWNENLVAVSDGAELFICEGYGFSKPENHHMSLKTLIAERHRLNTSRIVLTHLSEEALASRDQIPFEIAEDGKVLIDQ